MPAHLAVPMMLMRENMGPSLIQMLRNQSTDLALTSHFKLDGSSFKCSHCSRSYKLKSSLRNHQKWECGKEPQFKCSYCDYRAKQKMHMARHMERMHKDIHIKKEADAKTDLENSKEENGVQRLSSSISNRVI